MNTTHKVDENVIKKIIKDNLQCKDEGNVIQFLVTYCNNLKTENMAMKNNLSANKRELSKYNIAY